LAGGFVIRSRYAILRGHGNDRDPVRVIQPDTFGVGSPIIQLWAAAVPREQAVEAVLKNFPHGWKAEISEDQLTENEIAGLTIRSRCGD
jgi:hypothetical protein